MRYGMISFLLFIYSLNHKRTIAALDAGLCGWTSIRQSNWTSDISPSNFLDKNRGIIMIEKYSSGRIIVNDITYHQDLKIIQGRVVDNWWRKTGHRVDVDDMKDVLDASPDVIVIGTGYAENMRVSKDLTTEISQRDIRLIAENTNQAVRTFNDLFSKGKNVSGAFHLTC
jgi:hypothetical protein